MAALAVASGTVGYGNPTCRSTTTDVGQVSIPAASSLLPPRGNPNPFVVAALAGASTSLTGYAPRGPQPTTRATKAAALTGSFAPSTKPELLNRASDKSSDKEEEGLDKLRRWPHNRGQTKCWDTFP